MKALVLALSFLVAASLCNLGARHSLSLSAASDGRLVLLSVDSNRFVQLAVQIANDEDRFSPFQNMGGIATSTPAAGYFKDGGLAVFVRNEKNEIAVKHAMTDKSWSVWKTIANRGVQSLMEPLVVNTPQGMEIYIVGVDEHLYVCREKTSGDNASFTPWEIVSHHQVVGLPSFAVDSAGNRRLYIRGGDNFVYETTMQKDGTWGKLVTDSTLRVLGDPKVVANSDGRLEVFVRGANNAVYHKYQKATKSVSDWTDWSSLDGLVTANPAVAMTWDKRLEVFARGSDNAVWSKSFDWDEGWAPWSSLGGKFVGSPRVARYSDGRLIIFSVARDATVWSRSQTAIPDAKWLPWKAIGGDVFN